MIYQPDIWAVENSYPEKPITQPEDPEIPLSKPIVTLFLIITAPIWLIFSIVAEIVVFPVVYSLRFADAYWNKKSIACMAILMSPLVLVTLILVATILAPISVVAKFCTYICEDNIILGLEGFIYPQSHPIFGRCLKEEPVQEESYIQKKFKINKKKKKNAITVTTQASYQPPSRISIMESRRESHNYDVNTLKIQSVKTKAQSYEEP